MRMKPSFALRFTPVRKGTRKPDEEEEEKKGKMERKGVISMSRQY